MELLITIVDFYVQLLEPKLIEGVQ